MADRTQRAIIKAFRKYSHSLGPDSLAYLEEIVVKYAIPDDEVEASIEFIAKEYNRQDDASMKVTLPIIQRVYESMQGNKQTDEEGEVAKLDPDSHLFFIDAFEMPTWHWSVERSTFEKPAPGSASSSTADARIMAARDRLHIIRQTVIRNEHFSPTTLPSKDREHLLTLRTSKQLLGRAGQRFLLFGLLAHDKEGKLCLEDQDGSVELDFSQLDQPSEGLFTEGCFALVEGDYTEDATLVVIAVGHPPCESRETARSIYGHIDFLGQGMTTLQEDSSFASRLVKDLPELSFFVLSDVWLDHPDTFPGLRRIFDNCLENEFVPKVIILCGNFTSTGIAHGSGRDLQRYQENFEALADLIASYPSITRSTHFIFVPGPLDMTSNSVFPRRPLLSTLTTRLKSKLPRVHFGSNPCRIKYFGQEIVIIRENLMARMLRNLVGVKPRVREEDLKRYLVQSLLDQSHLLPFTQAVQPIASTYDHTLRLYPLPTAVVLADQYDSFRMTYEGCHVFNPGQFIGNHFCFSSYTPAARESEPCILDRTQENE